MSDDFDSEPPTRPEAPRECPRCVDETGRPTGRVPVTRWDAQGARHSQVMETCNLCGGRKLVGRATLERFKAMDTIPPPTASSSEEKK
jgi:hypothetical protein